jgi:hypothetical protein
MVGWRLIILTQVVFQLTLVILKRRPHNPQVMGSSPVPGNSVSVRIDPSKAVRNPCSVAVSPPSALEQSILSSRMDADDRGRERPPSATETATILLPGDPGLATVLEVWDRLPEALRAGIVAMVKAAGQG